MPDRNLIVRRLGTRPYESVWGAMSDRRGRRPVLLLTLTGTAFSYVLWIVSGSFLLLIVARLVGGVPETSPG